MKYNIYVYKNLTLDATAKPFYDTDTKEVVSKNLERSLMMKKDEEVAHLVNTELYFLGTYDDEKIAFDLVSSPVKLIDFNQFLDERKVRLAILAQVQKAREEKAKVIKGESKNG